MSPELQARLRAAGGDETLYRRGPLQIHASTNQADGTNTARLAYELSTRHLQPTALSEGE